MKQTFILAHETARNRALEAVKQAPDGFVVTVGERTRSGDQNALLWALLGDVSRQVVWHGNKLTPENWKDIFSASLKQQKVVPNLDGTGFVVCGQSTRKMGKREFSDLCELILAFGTQNEVKFNEDMQRL